MKTYEMHVFFELMVYKWWGDPKPTAQFIKNTCFISSEKDFDALQNKCLERTKDRYVSARVEREIEDSTIRAMSEDEFFQRLNRAYLTMHF